MPFGAPSCPDSVLSNASTSAQKHKRFRHESANAHATFAHVVDREWIAAHLEGLNQCGENQLTRAHLDRLSEQLSTQLDEYIGLPIPDVFKEISPVLLHAVLAAQVQQLKGDGTARKVPERKMAVATPVLGQFLVAINGFVQARNEAMLASYLALEPPFGDLYLSMQEELKRAYPPGNEAALEEKCSQTLRAAREGDDGSPWTSFIKFIAQYLRYFRDVTADVDRYLETYDLLSELQQRANSALSHATLGHLILPVVEANARLVCRLAIGLDKQPGLIAHLRSAGGGGTQAGGGEDGGPRETLPERAANILRHAFVMCLNDRTSALSPTTGKPEGKKRGIYTIANLCLKILFQCRKTRNATQIFENIYNLSPPLAAYPKRDRVTYLYYLGRFLFQNSHFYRAQLALQAAYDECPTGPQGVRQRRHILVYLLASNLILGRFPSQALLSRPEAQGLSDHFLPLCFAIRQGNLAAFRAHLAFDGPHAPWFLHFRILLQLQSRAEVLVWRSLVRKTWILNGSRPAPDSRVTPQVAVADLVTALAWLEAKSRSADDNDGTTDPDFHGIATYDDDDDPRDSDPTTAIESKLSSLIDQSLLGGFIAHRQGKFAITGVKAKGGDILAAGFPLPWGVSKGKAERAADGDADEVPGWKRQAVSSGNSGGGRGGGGWPKVGPGTVLNFSSMRPVGAFG